MRTREKGKGKASLGDATYGGFAANVKFFSRLMFSEYGFAVDSSVLSCQICFYFLELSLFSALPERFLNVTWTGKK